MPHLSSQTPFCSVTPSFSMSGVGLVYFLYSQRNPARNMYMLSTQAESLKRPKKLSKKTDCRTLSRKLLVLNCCHRVVLILADNPSVIHGKVEEISLPDDVDHVDIIISEWMGYALLYESMLDSVLHARDRFLRPNGGVMAPSQCRMMLALCEGSEIMKDRVDFWNDVYGAPFFDHASSCH